MGYLLAVTFNDLKNFEVSNVRVTLKRFHCSRLYISLHSLCAVLSRTLVDQWFFTVTVCPVPTVNELENLF